MNFGNMIRAVVAIVIIVALIASFLSFFAIIFMVVGVLILLQMIFGRKLAGRRNGKSGKSFEFSFQVGGGGGCKGKRPVLEQTKGQDGVFKPRFERCGSKVAGCPSCNRQGCTEVDCSNTLYLDGRCIHCNTQRLKLA